MTDRRRPGRGEVGCGEVVAVHGRLAVQIEESGAGLAEVAAHGRQERTGPHDVAARSLALEALSEPEERGTRSVEPRRLLDQRRGDAGGLLAPGRSAGLERRLELVEPDRVPFEQVPVGEPVAHDDVQKREREGCVAAGKRLQVKVGAGRRSRADRVDDDDRSRRLAEPVLVLVRGGGGRIRAPDDDARRIPGRARIEAELGGSVDVAERDVAGVVADRVRFDLGGAEPVEESLRERVREQAERAGVVGVQDGRPALVVHDPPEAPGDLLRAPRPTRSARSDPLP